MVGGACGAWHGSDRAWKRAAERDHDRAGGRVRGQAAVVGQARGGSELRSRGTGVVFPGLPFHSLQAPSALPQPTPDQTRPDQAHLDRQSAAARPRRQPVVVQRRGGVACGSGSEHRGTSGRTQRTAVICLRGAVQRRRYVTNSCKFAFSYHKEAHAQTETSEQEIEQTEPDETNNRRTSRRNDFSPAARNLRP